MNRHYFLGDEQGSMEMLIPNGAVVWGDEPKLIIDEEDLARGMVKLIYEKLKPIILEKIPVVEEEFYEEHMWNSVLVTDSDSGVWICEMSDYAKMIFSDCVFLGDMPEMARIIDAVNVMSEGKLFKYNP